MEPNGNEKDNLTGPPGFAAPAGPPPYGAVNMPAPSSQYYPGVPQGNAYAYAMPGQGGFPQMNPRYQGYSPLYNEDGSVPVTVGVTHTTIVTPVLISNEPDYLGFSIFNLLCCCLPLGIVALIYSLKTQDCNARGDAVGAMHNSNTARTLNRVAFTLGFIIFIIYLICIIVIVIVPQNQHKIKPPPFTFGERLNKY